MSDVGLFLQGVGVGFILAGLYTLWASRKRANG